MTIEFPLSAEVTIASLSLSLANTDFMMLDSVWLL